ncbi:MAG TPA: thermopsin family protease [Thermoplasmata archaeon]|nr:thermopsin family protease [Thermoplasmata archaeon]
MASNHAGAAAPAVVPVGKAAAPPSLVNSRADVSVGGSDRASEMAAHALATTRAAGLKSNIVFVPRPSASPAQVARAQESGVVSPLYTGDPAPIGLAYYGLSGTGTGPAVATILNTTAVQGTVDANATGIQGLDLYQSSPDSYGIQLNSVLTNVTLFGQSGFSFWTQNVVEYYPSSGFMVLITNIWNFSGGSYNGNEFYQHGSFGTNYYGELGYYYAELVVPFPVYYPFNLTLTMNSGINDGRDNMSFSDSLVSPTLPGEDFSVSNWDYAIFNSTTVAFPGPLTNPSNYTANGESYDPLGLTNDFELDICGPGGGSQVDLGAADATLGLSYLSGGTFVSVPAAYNYGGETGETATGANVAWSNAPGGPGNLPEYGTMTTGPSILSGLWGTGAPEGSDAVTLNVSPANAFNFLEYMGSAGFITPIVAESEFAPTITGNTLYLMPGSYSLRTELSDFAPTFQTLTVAGPQTVTLALTPHHGAGVYTPLWAFSNAEVAAIATSGSGTAASPYMLPNHQGAALPSDFGLYNDYGFPVFPGVFLMGTTVSTELYQPASFLTATNDFQFPGDELPQTNDLQLWFWNVTGVSLVDAANISGWFTQDAWYPISFDSFNVIFYASSDNLIAGNHFDTQSQALLLFDGGTLFGPVNTAGGNNTIWGNTFVETPEPSGCPDSAHCSGLLYQAFGLGLQLAEDGDLVYDNSFNTPTTAWLLPLNMYSGYPFYYVTNSWNITPQSASIVHYAAGFPNVPLSGSIVGGTTQGGNYWWDYGLTFNPYNGADNPYGVLPYDENATTLIVEIYGPSYYYQTYIYAGGDFAPLLSPTVTFVEHGLVPGTAWGVEVTVGSNVVDFNTTSNFITVTAFPAPGRYTWTPIVPVGYASHGGTFRLTDHPITVGVTYRLAAGYAFLTVRESGLPPSSAWSVVIAGTSPSTDPFGQTIDVNGTSAQVVVLDGTYTFTVPGVPGFGPSPSAGSLTIAGSATLHVRFHLVTYALSFTESGVPAGKQWGVRITGPVTGSGIHSRTVYTRGTSLSFTVPNGTYSYTVLTPAHTVCTPSSGSQAIAGSGASVGLVCVYTPPSHQPVNLGGAAFATASLRPTGLRGPTA